MTHNFKKDLTVELLSYIEKDTGNPFPYIGCRKLLREDKEAYEGLIPDLDMYFYDIASHCGGVKKILDWSEEKIIEAQKKFSKSFFDVHAEYTPLKPQITESNTPDLYFKMISYEKMRQRLLELLTLLLSEREQSNESANVQKDAY
jgi:hypothetical protein